VSCAETSEPIDLAFGLWTRVDRRKNKFSHIRQVAPICPHMSTWNGILAPLGEYDWTVRLRQRCGLMSNYFDHLLYVYSSTCLLPKHHHNYLYFNRNFSGRWQ